MADDIDIEEHSVLDNPLIRNIFPDLMSVKIEVPDSDDESQHMETDSYEESRVSHQSSLQFKRSAHKNHIILGSKPTVNPICYDDHPSNSDNDFNEKYCDNDTNVDYEFGDIEIKQEPEDSHDEEIERHGSCIILGSKPNRSAPVTETHDVYSSVVMLEDWGPKLQHSNCYCKDCEILFPTRNCLDAHNMATHSFLVALSDDPEILDTSQTVEANVSVNKAIKSTAKNLHFSTKSNLSEPSTSKEKFCNHCNKMFPSKAALIAHLYENLTATKFPCEKCDRIFNKEPELIQHIKDHHAEDDDDDDDDTSDGLYNQCDVCFCLFRRSFLRHMLQNHGKSTYSTKKVPFSGICKFCGTKCSTSRYLNKHISRHPQFNLKLGISKLLKSSKALKSKTTQNLQQVSSAINPDIRRPNFRCLKCGQVFAAYDAAQRHKKTQHPEMLNQPEFIEIKRIPVPVLTKKSTEKTKIKDETTFLYNGVSNPPVPKSVLFKCNKCPLHFANCTDAVFHAYRCVKETDIWNCDECCRSFKCSDKIFHERQHIVSDRFVVHPTQDNVYERTLCQCPKCEIYYSEHEFWVHLKQGCSQPKSVPCHICNILIHVSSTNVHTKLHKSRDINTKDLILIEFVSLEEKDGDNEENVFVSKKRKVSDDYNASDSKKTKLSTENHTVTKASRKSMEKIIYYCEKCKTYWNSPRVNMYHQTFKCGRKKTRQCKKCGLSFTSEYHDKMMHKSDETIFDFTFIRVQDNKVIMPMPSYPKCLKCNVHFLNLMHHCSNDYKICEYCNKMFDETAYSLHVTFHVYALRNPSKTGFIDKPKGSQAKKTLAVEKPSILPPITQSLSGKSLPMPELLKKYELMTNTWNILYLCEVCDIVCDSYDKIVEHSQDHFNKIESYDMIIANCEICDLRFDGTCFDKHKDMHDENASLNREFFNILKYNYMNLFSDNWFELFRPLPRTQIEQIVSQSIYVHNRNIRMRITQRGPTENTVYKCGRCNGYLTASLVGDHFERPNCWSPRYKCKLCYLDFSMNVCLKEHQMVCRTTQQSYREVIFNDVKDDSFNRGLQMTKSEKSSTYTTHVNTKDTLYKLFKCEICQCCIMLKTKRKKHKCRTPSERVKCKKCDLFFLSKTVYRHKALHMKFPKLSKRTVMTIPFKPESCKVLPKLYKCQCGLHFTSLQTAEKHLTLCKPGYWISKENCSKCGLLFPTSVLVSHLCSHHNNDKRTEFNIQHITLKKKGHSLSEMVKSKTKTKLTLYKCAQCDICFFTKSTLRYHFNENHKINMEIQHCKLCGVNFTKYSMTRHVLRHHKLRQCSRDDLNIKIYKKIADEITELSASDDKINYKSNTTPRREISHENENVSENHTYYSKYLYKCSSCDIHFLCLNACSTHYSRYHEKNKNVEQKSTNCLECGLAFSPPSLVHHTQIQHGKMKLKREDFIVIQSDRNVNKNLYKCDRCDVHFITHRGYLKHCSEGIHPVSKVACHICSYHFTSRVMKWHIYLHHKSQKMRRNDFNIITEVFDSQLSRKSETNTWKQPSQVKINKIKRKPKTKYNLSERGKAALDMSKYDNTVYLCSCGLHYLTLKRFRGHLHECNKQKNTSGSNVTCKICGLLFSIQSLSVHQYIQHEKFNLKLEDFRIVTEEIGLRQSNDTGLDNQDVSADFHDASSVSPNLTEQEETTSYTAEDSESTGSPSKNDSISKSGFKYSKKFLKSLKLDNFSNQLYRCKTCHNHYINLKTAFNHDHVAPGEKCSICGLVFTSRTMSKHKYVHHERWGLSLADFSIQHNIDDKPDKPYHIYKYPLYKCDICDMHFIKFVSALAHTDESCAMATCEEDLNCVYCGLRFSACSLETHEIEHHRKRNLKRDDLHIIHYSGATRKMKDNVNKEDISSLENNINFDESEISKDKADESEIGGVNELESSSVDASLDDLDSNVGKPSTSDSFERAPPRNLIKLYKCGDCNVFYITQSTCYKHVLRHKPLDSMEYIECKLCGLQFGIITLHKHIMKHHKKDFNLKNVLIEEYQSTQNQTPKIDIYYALDKLQSRLVSTTTDSKDVSEERVDSTVGIDVVERIDDQDNTKKDNLNTEVEKNATTSIAKNTTGFTVTEDIAKEQIMSESIEIVSGPVTDENLSMITLKGDSHSIDQIVTATPVSDAAINKTVTESHVKDVINNVVDQMLTENTVLDNINASAKEAGTGIIDV